MCLLSFLALTVRYDVAVVRCQTNSVFDAGRELKTLVMETYHSGYNSCCKSKMVENVHNQEKKSVKGIIVKNIPNKEKKSVKFNDWVKMRRIPVRAKYRIANI